MRPFMDITKALSDDNRVRLLCALQPGELCVCQLIELIGLAPSTVSKHMTILRQAGLITSRSPGPKERRGSRRGWPGRRSWAVSGRARSPLARLRSACKPMFAQDK